MHAQPGDWLVVKGPWVDAPEQRGRILEVRSAGGAPPYVVRWTADDRARTRFDRVQRFIHEGDGDVRVR
ncbi:DUF1918 domain-containing protein [Amycolatopsis eburnea]|uniref:DUF1918 domain-containing protein n=1 Tax=Amycolatopsis eburnea TaxID=2267691 RepID=A0A427T1N3_9PSEU|nr:DUF1918 domain-containing protein [Amycolatopsis eburnea]RSD11643.1 DUF1918 domain-containing protein [Amycolatopsis eburnea]